MNNYRETENSNKETETEKNELKAEAVMDETAEEVKNAPEESASEEDVNIRESWEQNRTGKKDGKRFRKKDIIWFAVLALAVIAVLIFASRFVAVATKRTVKSTGRQYYAGAESVFDADTEITQNDQGEAVRKEDGQTTPIADLPIYFDGEDALMITEDMLFYDPRMDTYEKVDQFSEISRNEGGNISAAKDDRSARLGFGFLYNGGNIYVLLEPMTLKINGYTMELPALSYIDADYQNGVQVFNYDTKEAELIPVKDEVELSAGDAYTVLTISDAIIMPDGSRVLLFGAPDQVDSIYAK